ncbi:hypothetical protein BDZ91DRAFT_711671 [Kalaharituber pfeilii]|nr:hypothetical protein BDZ91DRAFT_711671 [Kalaharituber pfeilii]
MRLELLDPLSVKEGFGIFFIWTNPPQRSPIGRDRDIFDIVYISALVVMVVVAVVGKGAIIFHCRGIEVYR